MDILTIIFGIAVLLFSAVVHEVAHGVMAVRLGDPTPKLMGRITLNPLKHLSLWGSFILPGLLILLKSPIIFGWAKPMPFNPSNISDKKWGPAKVALAGPGVNIFIAMVFAGVAWILSLAGVLTVAEVGNPLSVIIAIVIIINLSLAFFNLIPIPPLDGHYVLYAIIPHAWKMKLERYRGQTLILSIIAVLVLWQLFFPFVLFVYFAVTPSTIPLPF